MEKKKIMLIDPPGYMGIAINRIWGSFGTNKADQIWQPYDLQVFAGYCKKEGHDFKILDANNLKLSYGDIKKEIRKYSPDWVVYLTCFPNFRLDAGVARVAKEADKNIKTACISLAIFSVQQPEEEMKRLPYLDYIIYAEPEVPLMKLINGNLPKNVRGVYFRNKKSEIKFSGEASNLINLDELGIPIHSCIPYKMYKCPMAVRLPRAIVSFSRGCINRCVHCQAGSFQRPMRYRSVENVLEELDEIHSLGIKEIKFWDCSLPTNQKFVKELCKRMIEKKYNFTWHCNTRAQFVTPEILKIMKDAGCHTIAIGCESANNQILKNMNKNETIEEIEHAIKLIKKEKMRVLMYLTFGITGETEETMRETYSFAKKMNPEFITFGIVVPAPATPFYSYLKEKGYLIDKKLELQDPNALPAFVYPNLDAEKIHSFTRQAYRKYYFRPVYIFMRVINLRSITELQVSFTNALSVIKRYWLEKVR